MIAKCRDCKKIRFLTRHSKTGNHQPPFMLICRDCHDKRHGTTKRKSQKQNKKVQRGTPYGKNKKK